MKATRFVTLLVLVLELAVMGCGHAGDPGAPGPSGSAAPGKKGQFDQTKYVQCLREHGANVIEAAGGVGLEAHDPAQEQRNDAAKQACSQFAPDGGAPNVPDAAQLDELHRQVVCLRGYGFQVQDPGPPDYDIKITADRGQLETVDAAQRACAATPGSSR